MTIKPAFSDEFNIIQSIAARTWPITYGEILSPEQLAYMLEMMYSVEALDRNDKDGVRFILAEEKGEYYGFGGFEHHYKGENRTHIHKIYVLPEAQGKNVGKLLMHEMERQAIESGSRSVTLNVNRHNKAQHFYSKLGYEIAETVDISIGNGYLMEDYVMRKRL
ncbi:GNAT family N-acetyltransferase [Flavobacterium sp. MAH-1]|uniref:GNAT family N-acetyltransferase n=1 Tax=Flavobacterium agri TaxID=2743471 RepID=A0A7Y8XZQ9_9FLAO|nr:GNAT family N-acetyltransferase [Flavobacterium agri]NUY79750.1 GNAT family N-acetyltransferase [Flavobacterium agri]NYA69775.1 GNAT family N-acetyltransferase [Flavobacterium agri]